MNIDFEDIALTILGVLFFSILIFGIVVLVLGLGNAVINAPEAKKCVNNGGEPYYFITSVECRNNLNVEIK